MIRAFVYISGCAAAGIGGLVILGRVCAPDLAHAVPPDVATLATWLALLGPGVGIPAAYSATA